MGLTLKAHVPSPDSAVAIWTLTETCHECHNRNCIRSIDGSSSFWQPGCSGPSTLFPPSSHCSATHFAAGHRRSRNRETEASGLTEKEQNMASKVRSFTRCAHPQRERPSPPSVSCRPPICCPLPLGVPGVFDVLAHLPPTFTHFRAKANVCQHLISGLISLLHCKARINMLGHLASRFRSTAASKNSSCPSPRAAYRTQQNDDNKVTRVVL